MLQPRIALRYLRNPLNSTSKPFYLTPHSRNPLLRTLTTTSHLRIPAQSPPPQPPQPTPTPPPTTKPPADEKEFIPQPLGRPIGFPSPPKPGQNTSLTAAPKKTHTGTLKQKNLSKRADIVEAWSQNYFRDHKNIRKYRSGKTFLANPRIFKAEVSRYFPNLHGETLEAGGGGKGKGVDTTNVLMGKVSVVRLYSSQWGEGQVDTFTGKKENPELHEVLKEEGDETVQMVDINVEENFMKRWIILLFRFRLRRQREEKEWGRYFLVKSGVSQKVREMIGALNGRVGYVYLLDRECRIRWAGSANAEGTEMEDLNRGLRKLVAEFKEPKVIKNKAIKRPAEKVDEELEAQAENAGAS